MTSKGLILQSCSSCMRRCVYEHRIDCNSQNSIMYTCEQLSKHLPIQAGVSHECLSPRLMNCP